MMLAKMRKRRKRRLPYVFYSLSAQDDNLGDIAIRLRMLDWIRQTEAEIFVYVGPMSEEYLDAFDLGSGVTILKSKAQTFGILLGALLRSRIFLVFPPGPSAFGGSRNVIRSLVIVAVILALSAGGGGAIQVGTSYRRVGRGGGKLHKYMTSLLRVCVLRDVKSFAADHSLVAPDLAFGISELPQESRRFRLSISLRSDYQVDEQTLFQCKQIADENGWRLTFVTQVGRDDKGHRHLADQFGADVVFWEGNHVNQLKRVKEAYAESVAVVTDRLHALIFSMNLGALPVALVHEGNDKLTSTFKHVSDIPQIFPGAGAIPKSVVHQIQSHSKYPYSQRRALEAAEEKLSEVKRITLNALT